MCTEVIALFFFYLKFAVSTIDLNQSAITTEQSIIDYYDSNFDSKIKTESDYIYDEFKTNSELESNEITSTIKYFNNTQYSFNRTEEYNLEDLKAIIYSAENDYSNEIELHNELKHILNLNFQIKNISTNFTLPQFMVDLYRTITDQNTGSMINDLYKSSIILSIPELESKPKFSNLFKFNLTGLKFDSILDAELHIYKIGQRMSVYDSPYYLLQVYQILTDENPISLNPDAHQLLNVHYIYSHTTGWQVFKIKRAVESWLNSTKQNYGIYLTATTINNEPVDITFIRSNLYDSKYQPNLIIFAKDNSIDKNFDTINTYKTNITKSNPASAQKCEQDPFYIDFHKLGFKNIILFPQGYNAYRCIGNCNFPLSLSNTSNSTNYAKFTSVMEKMGYVQQKPCCVPEKMLSLPILLLDGNIVILKRFSNMIAASCCCR